MVGGLGVVADDDAAGGGTEATTGGGVSVVEADETGFSGGTEGSELVPGVGDVDTPESSGGFEDSGIGDDGGVVTGGGVPAQENKIRLRHNSKSISNLNLKRDLKSMRPLHRITTNA